MKSQSESIGKIKTLNELIDNASELPLECQDWLLAIAKAMTFTKNLLQQDYPLEKARKPPENQTA